MTTTTLDPTAFEKLHSALRPKVVSYLARFVGSSDAEDLAQEVFIKVHQGIPTFRGDSKLTTWVFQIATFAALDRLKSASYRASQHLLPEILIHDHPAHLTPAHDQQPMKDEMCRCIRGVVDRLPVDYRTIIYLSELKELKISEIAEIIGTSPGAAKIRLHRARQALRTQMEQQCRILLDEQADLQCDPKAEG
ncbi:MAG TPA: RNA polymerase sigma factor [Geothrix sp.]|nr:RNA polymerase sigma factor [Geothrix sp.]